MPNNSKRELKSGLRQALQSRWIHGWHRAILEVWLANNCQPLTIRQMFRLGMPAAESAKALAMRVGSLQTTLRQSDIPLTVRALDKQPRNRAACEKRRQLRGINHLLKRQYAPVSSPRFSP